MQAAQVLSQPQTIICCKFNSQALLLCENKQCNNFPFICANKKCQCYTKHPKCLKSQISSLTLLLQDKLVSFKQVQEKIKNVIQKSIDQLSRIQQELIKQIREKSFEFSGLNEYEKKFMEAIKQGKIQGLTGTDIFNIRQNLNNSQKFIAVQKVQKEIDFIWTQFQKDILKLQSKLSSKLNIQDSQILFKNSKIIKDQVQVKNIECFFASELKSSKWSEQLKSKEITINNNVVTLTKRTGYYEFCLLNASLSNTIKTKHSWAIKINKKTAGIWLGVIFKSKMLNYNFKSYDINMKETGHGFYAIVSWGYCFSHSQKKFNNVNQRFLFGVNDVICVEYNQIDNKLRFSKSEKEYFELSIIAPPQNDSYCPFVALGEQNDSVELIKWN